MPKCKLNDSFCLRIKLNLVRFKKIIINKIVLQPFYLIYLKEWGATSPSEAWHVWDSGYNDFFKIFNWWAFNNTIVKGLKVVKKSNLARLADTTLLISESSCTKKFGAINNIVKEARVQQIGCASSPCSSFAGIAVHNDQVFWVLLQPVVHLINQGEQKMEWRSMVILPIIITHSAIKSFFFINIFTAVENPIFIGMFFVQKLFNLCCIISPHCFCSKSWKTHDNNPILTDISQIYIPSSLSVSSSFSTNFFLEPRH